MTVCFDFDGQKPGNTNAEVFPVILSSPFFFSITARSGSFGWQRYSRQMVSHINIVSASSFNFIFTLGTKSRVKQMVKTDIVYGYSMTIPFVALVNIARCPLS